MVLCALLGLDPLPNIDEVNHSLMMMCCAGLFTETVYLGENRRNWILAQIFQYGQTNPCPMDSWQDFANTVLTFCNMELISKKFNFYSFPTALEDLVEEWQETLRTINATDYAPIRQAYLDRYREAQNLAYRGGLTRAYYRLADTVHVGEDRIKALFGRTTYRNSRGGREVLIALGIALGCTLRETNRMLLQINEPLLYPNLSDQKEIQYVQQLRQNETQRKY